MNSMNDERFFEVAMKSVTRQASSAEQAELEALLAANPERRVEFEQLRGAAQLAREALPLVNATEATGGEFPAYARGRLQTKVRQTYGGGRAEAKDSSTESKWNWRWIVGLATAAAALIMVGVPFFLAEPRVVMEVAVFDLAGTSRGGETNEVAAVGKIFQTDRVHSFSKTGDLAIWQANWPAGSGGVAVKVVFDRSAGEVRVIGRKDGKPFEKVFSAENDAQGAMKQAREFVSEQAKQR